MDYKKLGIIITVITCICISCNNKSVFLNSKIFSDHDLETVKLKGTIMQFSDTIMHPVGINIYDSLLFLKNRSTEYIYDIYNLKDNHKINECFVMGQGPDDFIQPIIVQSNDTNIWIYDRGKSVLYGYNTSELTFSHVPSPIKRIKFQNNTSNRVALISGSKIIASMNYHPEIGFGLYDLNGLLLDSIGKYPEVADRTLLDTEKIMSFQYDFTTNGIDRIFVCYYYTDLIEVYDYNGNLIERMHGPRQAIPKLEQVQSGGFTGVRSIKGETYKCYSSPVQAGNEVFVLYFGELYETYQERETKIFIFDRNGKPLKIYELDTHIFTFTVDTEHKIIYGISNSPEYHIVKFEY